MQNEVENGAFRMEGTASVSPAAAVPVRMKMPEPITAPIPRAVRLHGPSDLFSRLPGSSESAIRTSMFLVRSRLTLVQRFLRWPLTIL